MRNIDAVALSHLKAETEVDAKNLHLNQEVASELLDAKRAELNLTRDSFSFRMVHEGRQAEREERLVPHGWNTRIVRIESFRMTERDSIANVDRIAALATLEAAHATFEFIPAEIASPGGLGRGL